jgi:hypothetical protein
MIPDPTAPGKGGTTPWVDRTRREAWIAVEIAATKHEASTRTLAYYLRCALAHGLTVDEVCRAGDLGRETVLRLTDPGVAA